MEEVEAVPLMQQALISPIKTTETARYQGRGEETETKELNSSLHTLLQHPFHSLLPFLQIQFSPPPPSTSRTISSPSLQNYQFHLPYYRNSLSPPNRTSSCYTTIITSLSLSLHHSPSLQPPTPPPFYFSTINNQKQKR